VNTAWKISDSLTKISWELSDPPLLTKFYKSASRTPQYSDRFSACGRDERLLLKGLPNVVYRQKCEILRKYRTCVQLVTYHTISALSFPCLSKVSDSVVEDLLF
jgi:hypothetical protein